MRNRTSSWSRAVDGRSLRAEKLLAGLQASQSEQRKSGNRRHESRRALGLPEAALAHHTGTTAKRDLPTTTGARGGNLEAGRRGAKAWHPDGAGSRHPPSGDAGSAMQMVTDKRVLRLIGAFLKVGALENGLVSPADEGTPQGGPLSPLLSNIVLDELDRELERRKHRFVRYADDCNIYVRSRGAGQRVMTNVTRFLTRRLKLKVNEAKSAVARPEERKFLGFSFSRNKEPKRRIAPKALRRCKQKIRELTKRTRGISLEQMMKELAAYLRGWKSYFGFCQTPSLLKVLEEWIRGRLGSMIWKQWKRGKQRYAKLRQRGVGKALAAQTAGSPHGPWHLANSPALSYALPIAYFDSLGLPRLFDGNA